MSRYLDDREMVVCLSRFSSESLSDAKNRIISRSFKNIKDKSFYTESGIINGRDGEYAINILYQLSIEDFEKFEKQKFDTDKLYILPTKNYEDKYAVLIFENIEGYPPHKQIIFDNKKDAVEWIKYNLQYLPLHSLGGNPKEFQSDEEYKEFIFYYGMEEFFRKDY